MQRLHVLQCFERRGLRTMQKMQYVVPFSRPSSVRSSISALISDSEGIGTKPGSARIDLYRQIAQAENASTNVRSESRYPGVPLNNRVAQTHPTQNSEAMMMLGKNGENCVRFAAGTCFSTTFRYT